MEGSLISGSLKTSSMWYTGLSFIVFRDSGAVSDWMGGIGGNDSSGFAGGSAAKTPRPEEITRTAVAAMRSERERDGRFMDGFEECWEIESGKSTFPGARTGSRDDSCRYRVRLCRGRRPCSGCNTGRCKDRNRPAA